MSLPHNSGKSTAGIVVDPQTLERVVPVSLRPDGTARKVQKIRPGFVPVEDISRFRPQRVVDAERARATVPGSGGRASASTSRSGPSTRDQGARPPKSDSGSSSASTSRPRTDKRETRRVGESGHDVSLSWADDDTVERVEDKEEVDEAAEALGGLRIADKEPREPLGMGSKAPGGGAPKESVSAAVVSSDSDPTSTDAPPLTDPPTSSSPTDPVSSPPPSADQPIGASQLVSPEKTERDWKAARPPNDSGRNTDSRARVDQGGSGSRADQGGRWVRGGAPPPMSNTRGRATTYGSRGSSSNQRGAPSGFGSRGSPQNSWTDSTSGPRQYTPDQRAGQSTSGNWGSSSGQRTVPISGSGESPLNQRTAPDTGASETPPSERARREMKIRGSAAGGQGGMAAMMKGLVIDQGKQNEEVKQSGTRAGDENRREPR